MLSTPWVSGLASKGKKTSYVSSKTQKEGNLTTPSRFIAKSGMYFTGNCDWKLTLVQRTI